MQKKKKEVVPTTSKNLQTIQTWADAASSSHPKNTSPDQPPNLPEWLLAISHNPELLQALQTLHKHDIPPTALLPAPSSSKMVALTPPKPALQKNKELSQLQQNKPPSKTKPSSEYFKKSVYQVIIPVDDDYLYTDPLQTIERYFSKGWYYKPWSKSKTVCYYLSILEYTNSVAFKHFFLRENHTTPAYSTCTIFKTIHPTEWHQDLSYPRTIPKDFTHTCPFDAKCSPPLQFNYWDYQQAWFNAFLLQNHAHTHSWLFFFKNAGSNKFPTWFKLWWNYFGSVPDILLPQIQDSFNYFKSQINPTEHETRFPPLFLFSTNFFLPWVLSWTIDFQTHDTVPTLIRRFQVKWWDNFKIPPSLSNNNISTWLQNRGPKPSHAQTQFLAQKSHTSALLATAKTQDEYFQILQTVLQNNITSAKSDQSENSVNNDLVVDLANENEDDCYQIYAPIQH